VPEDTHDLLKTARAILHAYHGNLSGSFREVSPFTTHGSGSRHHTPGTPTSDYSSLSRCYSHSFGRGLCGGAVKMLAPSPSWCVTLAEDNCRRVAAGKTEGVG
jgi:hypothetical protein